MITLLLEENLLVRIAIADYIKTLQRVRNTVGDREVADGLDYDIQMLEGILFRLRMEARNQELLDSNG